MKKWFFIMLPFLIIAVVIIIFAAYVIVSNMPQFHAPWWCLYNGWLNNFHPMNWWCKWQEKGNPNWGDPNKPYKIELWVSDHTQTREKTQEILANFLKYKSIKCRCYHGYKW